MIKCKLAAAVIALLIFGSAADAEPDIAVLSMCQSHSIQEPCIAVPIAGLA